MNKLLTIVVPTYNMEAYLNRCLDSLIVSDEQLELLEVLVINDGSKDKSSAIAHEYEAKYPNTFRVIDKENGNYGSCINRGLQEAKGKYIKILDADDWFDTNELARLIRVLPAVNVDLILTDFSVFDTETQTSLLAYHPSAKIGEILDLCNCTLSELPVYMMHAVTYRTELLRSIEYVQTEGISYTDNEWTYNPLYSVSTVMYFDYNIYQYLIGRAGQTMDPQVMAKSISHFETIARSLIENYKKHEPIGYAQKTIKREIRLIIEKVYRTRLVLQDKSLFDNTQMATFDAYVKAYDLKLYKDLGRLTLKDGICIPYVLYWRIFKHRFPVDKIRDLYRKIRYGK